MCRDRDLPPFLAFGNEQEGSQVPLALLVCDLGPSTSPLALRDAYSSQICASLRDASYDVDAAFPVGFSPRALPKLPRGSGRGATGLTG